MNNLHLMLRNLGGILLYIAPKDISSVPVCAAEEKMSRVLTWNFTAWWTVLLTPSQIPPSFAFRWNLEASL